MPEVCFFPTLADLVKDRVGQRQMERPIFLFAGKYSFPGWTMLRVLFSLAQLVEVRDFYPQSKDKKYLLQLNDILICYKGSEATIGQVGLVVTTPEEPLIAGQSLCIVRVHDGHQIWLYYYLRQEKFRQLVLSRSSGRQSLAVNIGDLRNLTIVQPVPTQIAVVGHKHTDFLNVMENIRQFTGEAEKETRLLGNLVS